MTQVSLPPTPSLRSVIAEQFRVLGLALRRGAAGLVVLGLIGTAIPLVRILRNGGALHFEMDVTFALAGLGLLFPFAVWKGERLFGIAHLWLLPVDRPRHVLIKALAGWGWLMAATALVILWLVLMALITGGTLAEEPRQMLSGPVQEGVAPTLTRVQWVSPAWRWALPFTAATIGYLLSSAFAVGVKHPLRWAGAGLLLVLLLAGFSPDGLMERGLQILVLGDLGLDNITSGGTERLDVEVRLPDGTSTVAWREFPTAERWLTATLFWIGLGSLALFAAALRHRER